MYSRLSNWSRPGLLAAFAALFFCIAAVPTQAAELRVYNVLAQRGATAAQFRSAVERTGGKVIRFNAEVGVGTVSSRSTSFVGRGTKTKAISVVGEQRAIGRARPKRNGEFQGFEQRPEDLRSASSVTAAASGDPLTTAQWDMAQIDATPSTGYAAGQGAGVRVGVMDTGVDGTHPDIAPNFDKGLSRNFALCLPAQGATPADESCNDDVDEDNDGHGTHVAGTIASPLNNVGIGGVAPQAKIVNVRAGQSTGYFFLQPTVDALTYAADHDISVVNMSFYVDPWLYNCPANSADSPSAQAQQRAIIAGVQRALDYARSKGVLPVAALGNESTDLNRVNFDDTSPDYPDGAAYDRDIDSSCIDVPVQSDGVVGVSSIARSGRKAYYSNWSSTWADVSAPGGDAYDLFGTPQYRSPSNMILAPYPLNVGQESGDIDADGMPTTSSVVKDDHGAGASYYQLIQGTSMAAPHAAGVAALIVGAAGSADPATGAVKLDPAITEKLLLDSAKQIPCPIGGFQHYNGALAGRIDDAFCEGTPADNSFFGHGEVNAASAVAAAKAWKAAQVPAVTPPTTTTTTTTPPTPTPTTTSTTTSPTPTTGTVATGSVSGVLSAPRRSRRSQKVVLSQPVTSSTKAITVWLTRKGKIVASGTMLGKTLTLRARARYKWVGRGKTHRKVKFYPRVLRYYTLRPSGVGRQAFDPISLRVD